MCLVVSVVSVSLWPHGLWLTRLLCPRDSPGKNTGVDLLLQRIFPTQGSNPGLPRCRRILHRLSPEWCLFGEPRSHFFISDRSSVTPWVGRWASLVSTSRLLWFSLCFIPHCMNWIIIPVSIFLLSILLSPFYSPPDSSVRWISWARILEWAAVFFSRGSSWPRDLTGISCISCIGRRVL